MFYDELDQEHYKKFWDKSYALTQHERLLFEDLRINILKQIAQLIAKETGEPIKINRQDLTGKEIKGEPVRQNLHFHKAFALYKYYLPLLDELLGPRGPKNKTERKKFVEKVNRVFRLAKINFPKIRSGIKSKTKSLIDRLDNLVDALTYQTNKHDPKYERETRALVGDEVKEGVPLYLKEGFSQELILNETFILRLGKFAEENGVPEIFYQRWFCMRYEEYKSVEDEPLEKYKASIKSLLDLPLSIFKLKSNEVKLPEQKTMIIALEAAVNFYRNRNELPLANALNLAQTYVNKIKDSDITPIQDDISKQVAYITHHFFQSDITPHFKSDDLLVRLISQLSLYGDRDLINKYGLEFQAEEVERRKALGPSNH